MLSLALHNLLRRRVRSVLTLSGVCIAIGVLACLLAFGEGYQRELGRELNGMGMQMMLVPLGCPYDAAARVLKGSALDVSLPAASVETVRHDPAVSCAAPLLLADRAAPYRGPHRYVGGHRPGHPPAQALVENARRVRTGFPTTTP